MQVSPEHGGPRVTDAPTYARAMEIRAMPQIGAALVPPAQKSRLLEWSK